MYPFYGIACAKGDCRKHNMAKVSVSDKALREAQEQFRSLLEKKTREAEWQSFFTAKPFVLSRSLPLKILPCDIMPKGRPGKSEPDFVICPGSTTSHPLYGLIELKTPYARLITSPRRALFDLTRNASTGIRQLQDYQRSFDRYVPHPTCMALATASYLFLIMGRSSELQRFKHEATFKDQLTGLLSGVQLITFDALLDMYERELPRQLIVAVEMPDEADLDNELRQLDVRHIPVCRYRNRIYRSVVQLRKSIELFGNLVDEPSGLIDDLRESGAEPFGSIESITTEVGPSTSSLVYSAEAITRWPFEHPSESLFSDGSYGVCYGADSSQLALDASLELAGVYMGASRVALTDEREIVQERAIYEFSVDANLHDLTNLRSLNDFVPEPWRARLHAVGKELLLRGSRGILYAPKNKKGRAVALFSPQDLTHGRLVKVVSTYWHQGILRRIEDG